MSSSRVDSHDTGGGDNFSSHNSSTERIQNHFSNYRLAREKSPTKRRGSPITNNMTTPQRTTPSHRRKTVRPTLSSRESSPSRPNVSTAARGSQLHINSVSLQQAPEGHPPPRLQRQSSNIPQWPSSPRLAATPKVPPRSPALAPRKTTEQVIVPQPPPLAPSALQLRVETVSKNISGEDTELDLPSGMRTPRANNTPALETVVESSLPSTPAIGTTRIVAQKVAAAQEQAEGRNQDRIIEITDGDTTEGESTTPTVSRSKISSRVGSTGSTIESESESGFEGRFEYSSPSKNAPSAGPQRVFTRRPTIVNTLQQHSDGSRNMETETVPSLGGGPVGTGASIRSKKSSETIRAPRKEKKKRPVAVANPNPASTKAEFFGAQVAAAVHEADSSDSDETYVYESNPPDQRPTRFHSRTPSTSSVHGTLLGGPDPRVRNHSLHDQQGQLLAKSKMKFGANRESSNASIYGDTDSGNVNGNGVFGPAGGTAGSSRNEPRNVVYPRHGNYNGHRSILPDDSPFASEHKTTQRNPGMSHISPKNLASPTTRTHTRNGRTPMNGGGNGYGDGGSSKRNSRNLDRRYAPGADGDDERAPLLHHISRYERDRNNTRARTRRLPNTSLLQLEHNEYRRRGWIGRCAGCIIAVVTILMVIIGTVGFMFATSKPLQDVKIRNMTDVLVSQQEIMFDLVVQAMNPNMIGVTVQTMDVNLFAKSAWVRDPDDKDKNHRKPENYQWEERSSNQDSLAQNERFLLFDSTDTHKNSEPRHALSGSTKHIQEKASSLDLSDWFPGGKKGVDEGTDPDPDLPDQEDKQTMLLGRILSFDSALNFDASPLQHCQSTSKGSVRLAKPGNKTETGGTERWERVVLHPFELILRGVLKYQTPLSGKWRTASIGASVMVNPADDDLNLPVEE